MKTLKKRCSQYYKVPVLIPAPRLKSSNLPSRSLRRVKAFRKPLERKAQVIYARPFSMVF
jgi:hypothetical protein